MKWIAIFCFISILLSCESEHENDFEYDIVGTWTWIESCGGITGECWYPSVNNERQVIFDRSMRYIEKQNDSILKDVQYSIVDTFRNGPVTVYTIDFKDTYQTYFWFSGNRLNIQGGDFVDEYVRSK
jgi:hypothetical protein